MCRNAKPGRLSDGDGLYLLIEATRARGWRFDYRIKGKRKTISFGPYPRVSIGEARDKREKARDLVKQGIDPSSARKEGRAAAGRDTFRAVAQEWWSMKKAGHAEKT